VTNDRRDVGRKRYRCVSRRIGGETDHAATLSASSCRPINLLLYL
jgi:hypothetical protein